MNVKQVWQRVQESAGSLQERQSIQKLLEQLKGDAAFLRRHPGGQTLAEELEEQAAVLLGLQALATGQPPKAPLHTPAPTHLRQCYAHSTDRLKEYLLRTADPQFGPVYQSLANRTQAHCLHLAALIGKAPHQHHR